MHYGEVNANEGVDKLVVGPPAAELARRGLRSLVGEELRARAEFLESRPWRWVRRMPGSGESCAGVDDGWQAMTLAALQVLEGWVSEKVSGEGWSYGQWNDSCGSVVEVCAGLRAAADWFDAGRFAGVGGVGGELVVRFEREVGL